ncbi:hypothetical protein CCR75_004495 [Bremia lactucae]|uniref:Uncharacterized protein n=1 Tax=Bremia lactucae TaxID=4779 RepID=A0A976FKU7_BRELC|nr:hypothetical protein CCR75_005782 [Bremia lactucae]TDH68231.1 hypothetical protein CCR75_004495 [Bremia lactucae]
MKVDLPPSSRVNVSSPTHVAHVLPLMRSCSMGWWLPRVLLLSSLVYALVILAWSLHIHSYSRASIAAFGKQKSEAKTASEILRTSYTTGIIAQQREQEAKVRATSGNVPNALQVETDLSMVQKGLRIPQEAAVATIQIEDVHDTASKSQSLIRNNLYKKYDKDGQDVRLYPQKEMEQRDLKCIGWRATGKCSPYGPRKPEKDEGCDTRISPRLSGFCEVEDTKTGERFRVMQRYCNSLKDDAKFFCSDAAKFVNFRYEARKAVDLAQSAISMDHNREEIDSSEFSNGQRDGIVMVVYPKLVPSAYAAIKTLRSVLGCKLPIEIWYSSDEMDLMSDITKPLNALASENPTLMRFQEITIESHNNVFGAKIAAIYHSRFARLLFLDADNMPSRDPTFLFNSREFLDHGAVFWPDLWHPNRTIFNIHSKSLLWELLDMPFIDMFEQESGQLLIDRRRHTLALELVMFYSFHKPNFFTSMQLVHGDKDLFRLAWLTLEAPFHMIKTPPALAGKFINNTFCGLTMAQHDAQGAVLFLHRNSHKLMGEVLREHVAYKMRAKARLKKIAELRWQYQREGKQIPVLHELHEMAEISETPSPTVDLPESDGYPDAIVWTHLQSFKSTSKLEDYNVQAYSVASNPQRCYGEPDASKSAHFGLQEIATLPFAGLETYLRRYAAEAVAIQMAVAE